MNINNEVSLHIDTLIVETVLSDGHQFVKNAQVEGILSGIISKVKQYVDNNIDPNNKISSILDMLAPGAISVLLGALGFKWIGTLIGLSMNIFHINVSEILSSIYEKIKSEFSHSDHISSATIDNIVHSSVFEHTTPATPQEANEAEHVLKSQSDIQLLQDAKLFKLAMIEYDDIVLKQLKFADASGFFSTFSNKKTGLANLLVKILGWIFKISLGAAGLLVTGDIVNKFLGRPNAIDNTYQRGRTTENNTQAPPETSFSHQDKFKLNSNYHEVTAPSPWILNINNNPDSIEQALVDMAEEVYEGLNDKEYLIIGSNKFKNIVDTISWYNRSSVGGPMVFIPKIFTSKKNLVDHFIDEVAEKAG